MSTRTSRADRNYLSYSDDTIQLYMGTDQAQPAPTFIPDVMPVTPQDWDAIIKVSSNDKPVELIGVHVAQGRENVIDCNREAAFVHIEGELGWGGGEGDQVITIKGGSHSITIAGTIHSRGRNGDVVLDAYSDQSHALVYDLDFRGLKRADGKPVTFVLGRLNRDGIEWPSNARILWARSVGYWTYYWAKLAYVKLTRKG